VLVLLALLEQVAAQKDRSKRLECRAHAYEYCLLAREMETSIPSTMMAQNHMANHYFHTWKIVIKGDDGPAEVRMLIRDQWQVELEGDAKELDIRVSDPFKINAALFTVKNISTLGSSKVSSGHTDRILISLSGKRPIDSTLIGRSSESCSMKVEVKQFGLVQTLATDVMKKTTVTAVKAESIYIIGRLFHAQNNIASAMEYYKVAHRLCPDLSLAVFGHAQILLAKQELGLALELFEKVLSQHPDDRDTQAYVMLVRGLHKKESSSLEKVREVATGFIHEVDLWLLQAQLRQTNPAEYTSALRCYTHALECMEQHSSSGEGAKSSGAYLTENPRVLSNIAVLHHSLGRLTLGLEFCRRALVSQQLLCDTEEGGNGDHELKSQEPAVVNPTFKNQQFEGIFYSWSPCLCTVSPNWTAAGWDPASVNTQDATMPASTGTSTLLCTFDFIEDGDEVTALFTPGTELLLQRQAQGETEVNESPVLHVVVSATAKGFTTRSHVHRVLLMSAAEQSSSPITLSVKRKIPGSNFSDSSITTSYNYARILEDLGQTNAAKEVYVQLLKQHPSFIDCKGTPLFRFTTRLLCHSITDCSSSFFFFMKAI
jgi:tetratricopeptide (TPR) repeat protein